MNGQAQTLKQAAEQVGCSREYLSRVLSERPDAVQYMKQRAARALVVSSTVAASRMAHLIHAESEHVSFRASEHVLSVSGIAPVPSPSVNVNIDVKAGYVIDLTPADEAERQMIERQAKVIVDDEPIDAKVD